MGKAARLAAALALGATQPGIATDPPFWPRFAGRRTVQLLDGEWQFGLNLDASFDSLSASLDVSDPKLTPKTARVPSTMDVAPAGIMGPRGVGMFRTKIKQTGPARLQFMGCSFYCRIFVDGKEVGEHRAGGFVPFWLDVPAPEGAAHDESKERELFVLADNRWNATTAPTHTGGDFYMYGGLVRSVLLHDLPPSASEPWVWRAHVLPVASDPTKVNINLVLTDPKFTGLVKVAIRFDNGELQQQTLQASMGKVELPMVSVPNPRLWSFSDPQLHNVSVTLADATIIERFGLRAWGVDAAARITLNGQAVKLHGWNHHTQWPESGASPSEAELDMDLKLLKEAGTNFVRGAHYPQDARWLDRMDEAGMAVWEETLGPSVSVANLQDWSHFMKYQLQQVEEMIDSSMNHPAIMTWGWFNEGPSDQVAACPAYAACAAAAQQRDPTRFRTWASNTETRDACLDHATLVSFNQYPSWYGGLHDLDAPRRHWQQAAADVRVMHPGKPFVISETGAGGLYEWSDNTTDAQWTLKYQTEVIMADVEVALSDDNIAGITLWHFFDFKADDDAQKQCGPCDYLPGVSPPTCGFYDMEKCKTWRPGGVNHKGVVDVYRRKKPSYDLVAAKFKASDAPLTYISV